MLVVVKIGVGVATHAHPQRYGQVMAGLYENFDGPIYTHVDGSAEDYDEYRAVKDALYESHARHRGSKTYWTSARARHGWAKTKNRVLRQMLDNGCDWLFVSGDGVVVESPEAVHGYIEACRVSGWGHLSFARGPGDALNFAGAWAVYSRQSLLTCGLMDERFFNCWEHVEHTLRLSEAGFAPRLRGSADAAGSEGWLREIEGSREVFHSDGENVVQGREIWREFHPDTYRLAFP